ncbi:MAG: hypothetical protein AABW88_03720 [Nanoarchaeota archaeon]
MKKVTGFVIASLFSVLSAAAQNPFQSFAENARTGALSDSLKNIISSASAMPNYIEAFLIFIILGFALKEGVGKTWPDSKHKGAISVSMSLLLAFGYLRSEVTLGGYIWYVLGTVLIGMLINHLSNPKKELSKSLISLAIGFAVTFLLIFGIGFTAGGTGFSLPWKSSTEQTSPLQSRLIMSSTGLYISQDPNENFRLGETALKNGRYAEARRYFTEVASAGNVPGNNNYNKAFRYINPDKKDDLIFKKMVADYREAIIARNVRLRDIALEIKNKNWEQGSAELTKAKAEAKIVYDGIASRKKELCTEFEYRGAPICN